MARAPLRRLTTALLALCGALTSACTPGSSDPTGTTSPASASGVPIAGGASTTSPTATAGSSVAFAGAAWARTDLSVASAAVVVGGVVVLYTTQRTALELTGLEATTGKTLWSRPATFSGPQPGIELAVSVIGDRVAYFTPADNAARTGELVLLDPAGPGNEVAHSRAYRFYSFPQPCADDPAKACVSAFATPDSYLAGSYRLGAGMSDLAADGLPRAGMQSIGEQGLVRLGGSVGVLAKGRLVWSKPEPELFGKDYSTNGGWEFRYVPGADVFYGSVGRAPQPQHPPVRPPVEPVTGWVTTVGFRARTGEVLWRAENVDLWCDAPLAHTPQSPVVACLWRSGEIHHDAGTDKTTVVKPVISLLRLDPTTGRHLWAADIGEISVGEGNWQPRPRLGPSGIVMNRVAGAVDVALADGAMRPADPGVATWGLARKEFMQDVSFRLNDGSYDRMRYGMVWEARVGDAVTTTVSLPLPSGVGVEVAGLRVLATKEGVAAYRQ